ncbi:MAG: DUF502 domain-containing protein [Terrimicrobiaceae bacterium]|nr:DUF502 domain-containing protein [Terrimicrobiaceae bacterium]
MIPEPTERARYVVRLLWSRLLTGIVITVPLIVTLWVLWLGYGFIAKISEPLWTTLGVTNSTLLNFCTTVLLLIAVGFMAAHVLGQRIIERAEAVLMRVPLIAPLYGAVKQMLDSFRMIKSGAQTKRVVYLEYPSEGSLLIGFVTGQYFEPRLQRRFTLVFLPMAPNPLAGFVVAVPAERIIECSLTFEEASKLIVSGGLVVPPFTASAEVPTPR